MKEIERERKDAKRDGWLVLVLLGVGLPGMAAGGEPDPEAVRRLMEKL